MLTPGIQSLYNSACHWGKKRGGGGKRETRALQYTGNKNNSKKNKWQKDYHLIVGVLIWQVNLKKNYLYKPSYKSPTLLTPPSPTSEAKNYPKILDL